MPKKGSTGNKVRSDCKLNLEKFAEVCEWISQDKSYKSLRDQDPDKWPAWNKVTAYRKRVKAAQEMYEEARKTQAEEYLEQYNELMETFPKLSDCADKTEYFAEHRRHDSLVRALQFKINRLGPIFNSKSFNPKQEIEINDKRQDIQVINYAKRDSDGKDLEH